MLGGCCWVRYGMCICYRPVVLPVCPVVVVWSVRSVVCSDFLVVYVCVCVRVVVFPLVCVCDALSTPSNRAWKYCDDHGYSFWYNGLNILSSKRERRKRETEVQAGHIFKFQIFARKPQKLQNNGVASRIHNTHPSHIPSVRYHTSCHPGWSVPFKIYHQQCNIQRLCYSNHSVSMSIHNSNCR